MRIPLLLALLASTFAGAGEPTCSVLLTETGDQKINVIKLVREQTALGLKDAKELVEAPKPVLVRDGLTRAEADALVAAFAEKGAKAEVRQRGEHAFPSARQPTFDVKLESWGQSKINVIKIVRQRTGLMLGETKKLVESAPIIVMKGLTRPVADSMLNELTAAGATATLVPVP